MAKTHARRSIQQSEERHGRPLAGEEARQWLIATMPVEERRLDIAGISTAVLEGGDGPPVVLLHGPSGYAAHWLQVIPGLVTSHRVIAPDLPGHGASEPADGTVDADRVLQWLDELIERTCESPPALVGQTLGGAIAARFAGDHDHRLSRLVLVDSFGLTSLQPVPEFWLALTQFLAQPTERTHQSLWRYCAFDLDGLLQRMGERWDPFTAYNLDRARSPGVQAALSALMAQFGAPAIPHDALARIAVPTTLIWGRYDLATPLAVAEAAGARFGWPLHVIDECADDPPIERPEPCLRALHAALGGARPRGQGRTSMTALEQTRAAWDDLAPHYARTVTSTHKWLGGESLRRAELRSDMRFLDVAAGSGALSIPAARLGARVLATDLSQVMLDLLEQHARKEGLAIETRAMDGHALEVEDDSIDMAGSQFGVMLFPDMPKGIREMVRVVKPGGRVLMNVLGNPRKVEFFSFLMRAIQSIRPEFTGPSMDPPPLPFQLQDAEKLRQELAAAGLKDVTVGTITETLEFRTGKELWDWQVSSNPIVETILGGLHLMSEERDAIRQTLEALVRERAGGGGPAVLTVPINIGIGTK